jgi:23S rRNA pseudouridine2605 synthase
MRLQKALAEAGFASRRASEELIRAGRVTVDGAVAQLGASADPDTQLIAVDGRRIVAETKEYWLLNKPVGVLSAVTDSRGRRTVVDCVPTGARVFPVGRHGR